MSKDTVILVVDDEKDHADGIAEALEKFCAKAITVYNGKDALKVLNSEKVDIVVTDLRLGGDIDGLVVLEQARRISDQTQVILITAYATIDNCKQAIKQGAFDYLVKPIDIDQLRTLVTQAAKEIADVKKQFTKTRKNSKQVFEFDGIQGENTKMHALLRVLKRVSPTDISVLVEGESGTGKELLAKAIHNNSNRASKSFRPVNCAGLTETLLESELFGHVKGAFTGADIDRKGLFEIADKGTLFLDEIGDMPLNMQAKLLRVLEDGIITPVGSSKQIMVDVRIISATNHDLTKLIEQKKFRQDLYFRIKGVSVTLPPLRQRLQDIPIFVEHFAKQATAEVGADIAGMSEAALAVLMSYDWPGNIRQLKNCIKTMVVMAETDMLDLDDIPPEIHQMRKLTASTKNAADLGGISLNELEKQAIIDTLAKTENNREKAAKILGIGERTLYRKIKEYNL
ncbi:MAG: sigma-54-dependent Fis family transcriptional regulator [Planctomycetes bacterium]|nr:sigma-54-dependent Fis family transcriptional regulator [Planctomycetota bacterium]